jgi:hypothetical protein
VPGCGIIYITGVNIAFKDLLNEVYKRFGKWFRFFFLGGYDT